MNQGVFDVETSEEVSDLKIEDLSRIVLRSPTRGGPKLSELRAALRGKGVVRFSASGSKLFADVDPGPEEAPLIGLDVLARSDAAGLERMIWSALPHVDEIVIGIDGRSDEETRRVAEAYADTVWTFGALDIGLSEEEWRANRIHFASARNLGRERLRAPWALVLDTDEYVERSVDLRETVRGAGGVNAFGIRVKFDHGFEDSSYQRLAKSQYRWECETHNQLIISEPVKDIDTVVVHDPKSLRTETERARRDKQRDDSVELLWPRVEAGDLLSLFHLAKHKLASYEDEGLKLAADFRLRAEPHGPLSAERIFLAIGSAAVYYERDNLTEAELWALRALLDGPRAEAMCILGDIAEDQGDLERALLWYEMACLLPDTKTFSASGVTRLRWGRREGLRRALGKIAVCVESSVRG